ncbi:MAG: hypothetical protein ACYDB2_05800 [Acidimicrobiales bacterium]
MSDFRVHSFDAPRERHAPQSMSGRSLSGESVAIEFDGPTLVVAVKPHCEGCQGFIHGDLSALANVPVIVVSATTGDAEWRSARQTVIVAPEFMEALEIRSAPYYVLIDAAKSKVIGEGTLFSPEQVASEITELLTT